MLLNQVISRKPSRKDDEKDVNKMPNYIRATIGMLAFLGLIGCGGGGRPIDLILGTGFALTVWLCARPRKRKAIYIMKGEREHAKAI